MEGKTALIVDDIIDTAGTIIQGAAMLKQRGGKKVSAIATHGLFSPPAKTRLDESEIEDIIVNNSLALPAEKCPANLHIVSVSQLLGDMIWRIYTKQSVSSLLNDGN